MRLHNDLESIENIRAAIASQLPDSAQVNVALDPARDRLRIVASVPLAHFGIRTPRPVGAVREIDIYDVRGFAELESLVDKTARQLIGSIADSAWHHGARDLWVSKGKEYLDREFFFPMPARLPQVAEGGGTLRLFQKKAVDALSVNPDCDIISTPERDPYLDNPLYGIL